MHGEPKKLNQWKQSFSKLAGIDADASAQTALLHPSLSPRADYQRLSGYLYAALICAMATLAGVALRGLLDPANLILLYLITVVGVAVRLGQRPAILSSFLSVLAFDFFLVPPYHSLTVADTQYLLTFAIMLAVSLIISTLTANLRQQARIAQYRERRTSALFDLSRDLSAALTREQLIDIGERHLRAMFQADVALFLPDMQGQLEVTDAQKESPVFLSGVSSDKIQEIHDRPLPTETEFNGVSVQADGVLYLPLRAPMRIRGVLAIMPEDTRQFLLADQQRLLQTCAAQIALSIERVHYVEVAQEAVVAMKSEQLRNSLLSVLSHDLRTPLTAIVGLSSTLVSHRSLPNESRQELAEAIQEEALRMNSLVTNLLDMARLHAGSIKLNRQWQMLEEVIGSALGLQSRVLANRQIDVNLAQNLPLLEFDAVLIERVLCNLLENAAKYTPPGSPCWIAAECVGNQVQISVIDAGSGIPKEREDEIFEKFTRGDTESIQSGVGLGLSICRAIVDAHGGRIWVEQRNSGGARFVFTLPVGLSPIDREIPVDGELAGKDWAS